MEDGRAGVQAGKWVWSWTVLTSGGQVSHCSIVMKVQVHPLKRLLNTLFLKRLTFETCVAAAAQLLQRRLSAALPLTVTFLLPLFLSEILKIWSIHQVVLWFGFDSAGILIYRCWVLERQLSFFFIPKNGKFVPKSYRLNFISFSQTDIFIDIMKSWVILLPKPNHRLDVNSGFWCNSQAASHEISYIFCPCRWILQNIFCVPRVLTQWVQIKTELSIEGGVGPNVGRARPRTDGTAAVRRDVVFLSCVDTKNCSAVHEEEEY